VEAPQPAVAALLPLATTGNLFFVAEFSGEEEIEVAVGDYALFFARFVD